MPPPAFFLLLLFPLAALADAPPPTPASNPRLEKAYVALQALKRAITDDPHGLTKNWCGPDVCSYTGVFCAPAPDDPCVQTVAGVDLNHGDLAGTLPEELGLLSDLALLHLNSNRFMGGLPDSIQHLQRLFELDVSNNRLCGGFPMHVLCISGLKFLDLRFNEFHGEVPAAVFDHKFDAIFLNNNMFRFTIPPNFGNSTASVIVLANIRLDGCLPSSFGSLAGTLNELIILNAGIHSCIPESIGQLKQLTVLDLSHNRLVGQLPESLGCLEKLQQLDVAHNKLAGHVPESICRLPELKNFTYSYNYFCTEPEVCIRDVEARHADDSRNCILGRPDQRTYEQCDGFFRRHHPQCAADGCIAPPAHYSPAPPHMY